MRFLATALVVGVTATGSWGAAAQVPTVITAGTVANALARTTNIWCAIDRGNSTFQRSGNATARMSFPDITYKTAVATGYHTLNGQARLSFTTANSGYILFEFPPPYPQSIRQPKFVHYTQTYNSSKLLTVSFDIQFPQCTLRVDGRYYHN